MAQKIALLAAFLLCLAALSEARVRVHYIAAEDVLWNYAPTGMNVFKGVPLLEDPESFPFFFTAPTFIGGTYLKAVFREYTDSSFTEKKELGPDWEHLGYLGPPLYAEVGDSFEIHFKNMARYNFSMFPMGLGYEAQHDGAAYPQYEDENSEGGSVAPGEEFVYRWEVPGRSGPGPGDWSSVLYQYVSHVDLAADTEAGLVGPIIVTAKGMADEDGRPKDVDREFIILYQAVSESTSRYVNDNIAEFLDEVPPPEFLASFDWFITNLMHGINGMMFSNLPGLTMTSYERVRWYVLGMGSDFDIHTAHWHGQTFLDRGGHRADVTAVYPGVVSVVDMIPDSPGLWLTHCHVNAHVSTGMMALFEVLPVSSGYETVRNLATTSDLFSFLFESPAPVSPVVERRSYSTDPFSNTSSTVLASALPLVVAVFLALCV